MPAVIFIVSLLVYANTLDGTFVWDDKGLILSNKAIGSLKNIPSFFVTDSWKATGNPSGHYYRPVINTFWNISYQVWGLNPVGYHITNIVLHAMLSVLVYYLALKILESPFASFLSALIFATHPVHTENIAWITGAGYLISAIFILSTFLCYIQFREKSSKTYLMISLAIYTLAVFSIEYALMLPSILIIYEWLIRGQRISVRPMLLFIMITGLFLIIRASLVPQLFQGETIPLYSRILTSLTIQIDYLSLFFIPYKLKILYDVQPIHTLLWKEALIAIFVFLLITVLMCYFYRKNKKALFSLLWFFLILLPAANILVVLKPQMMSLRFLYIPSIGLSMLMGLYLEKISGKFIILPFLLIFVLSIQTFMQNRYWHDEVTLYEKMTYDAPASAIAKNNLGVAYLESHKPWKALAEFRKAVALDPAYGFALYNLGNTALNLNHFDEAAYYLQKAIEVNPSDSRAYNGLGVVMKKTGRLAEAGSIFSQALSINPDNYEAHYNLANLLVLTDRPKEAIIHYQAFIKLAPAKYNPMKIEIQRMLGGQSFRN
ncbi:MAG: tetratricopeptide repeat protein [Nitrospirota bacterium]